MNDTTEESNNVELTEESYKEVSKRKYERGIDRQWPIKIDLKKKTKKRPKKKCKKKPRKKVIKKKPIKKKPIKKKPIKKKEVKQCIKKKVCNKTTKRKRRKKRDPKINGFKLLSIEHYKKKRYFDATQKDSDYISSDTYTRIKHIGFLRRYAIVKKEYKLRSLMVKNGKSAGKYPVVFSNFKAFYPDIHAWWIHIIRSCLDQKYPFYRFAGARGAQVCDEWLNAKEFCRWALRNGLTKMPFTYERYLIRKNEFGDYAPDNVIVTSERDLHKSKNLDDILRNILLIKKYEEYHHPTVSYMTFYTRYYVYGFDIDSARTLEFKSLTSPGKKNFGENLGFSPTKFYEGAATEDSCTKSEFLSRIHGLYYIDAVVRPYELLKPDFSINEEARKQGKICYKTQWYRKNKDHTDKEILSKAKEYSLLDNQDGVYSFESDLDVYSE